MSKLERMVVVFLVVGTLATIQYMILREVL